MFFCLLGHCIQRITGLFVVYTCVFAFLGLQSTCTAARDGSLCVVGGQVNNDPGGAAGLVFDML